MKWQVLGAEYLTQGWASALGLKGRLTVVVRWQEKGEAQPGKLGCGQVEAGSAECEAPGRDHGAGEARRGLLEGEQRVPVTACGS